MKASDVDSALWRSALRQRATEPHLGQQIGRSIRARRLAAGMTQREIGIRCGMHRPEITRLEAGLHTPLLSTLAAVANALGCDAWELLYDAEDDPIAQELDEVRAERDRLAERVRVLEAQMRGEAA